MVGIVSVVRNVLLAVVNVITSSQSDWSLPWSVVARGCVLEFQQQQQQQPIVLDNADERGQR